jgi:hypothetical protein
MERGRWQRYKKKWEDTGSGDVADLALSARPGDLQNDHPVPGEDEVDVTPAELFIYANALAVKNGFSPIAEQQPVKDPNLVLPGDRLILPDGRILQIARGQYIYDIAAKEYRRDMARIALLKQQIDVLKSVYAAQKKPEIQRAILQRAADISRLAVTPKSRQRYEQVLKSLQEAGLTVP